MESVDGIKQYSLRWEKHAFNLATEAGCFFEDESFLDCTLSAEGQCIDAHKIILSASSSYLSSLLKLMPDKHPILIFNDMKFEQLKSLVAFIYNGSVNISENDIHGFLNAAQSLLIKGLYEEEPKDAMKGAEQLKKKKDSDVYEAKKAIHKFCDRVPPLRKPEIFQDASKCTKKERTILPKRSGASDNEYEDSLYKLQEISFTKYIHRNLNSKPVAKGGDDKLNDSVDEKTKVPENYVVRSWRHNSVDDMNGRHKQTKNNFLKKLRLEKNFPTPEQTNHNDKGSRTVDNEPEGKLCEKESDDTGIDDKMKRDEDGEARFLIEPKQEIIEEDDINSENYDKGMNSGMDGCASEADAGFDNRPVSNYFHHPAVDTGIPVPLLMCKTSLSEPDTVDSNWMPQVNNSITGNHLSQHAHENPQDLQCRTCTQDLPCPTCTKKYKSRYALNRHILYECGKARKSFSCDECGKKVTRQDTLQKHKLIHLVQHLKDKESESKVKKKR